jgi:regulator of replication initiation timing
MLSQSSTKELASAVSRIEMRIRKNLADIANYQAIIAKLEAENATMTNKKTDLVKDIPEPVVEEPVEPIKEI